MKKSIKSIFFVFTLVTLLIFLTGVNAADDNNTAEVISDNAPVSIQTGNAYDNTKITDKIITKEEEKELKSAKTVNVNNYKELNKALNDNANNTCTINLKKGTYKVTGNNTPYLDKTSNIIINGNQSTIIGYNINPYKSFESPSDDFVYTEGKLTINNLTFKNFCSIMEGYDKSTIILNNCNFTDNHAVTDGVLRSNGDVKIHNCNFINNSGTNTAIMEVNSYEMIRKADSDNSNWIWTGIVEVINSTFKNNYVNEWDFDLSDGPGENCFDIMSINNNKTNIINCTFDNNYAKYLDDEIGYGQFYIGSNHINITNSNFKNMQNILTFDTSEYEPNETPYYDGVLLLETFDNGSYIYLTNNNFENINSKTNINTQGGVIWCWGPYGDNDGRLNLYNNTFKNINIISSNKKESTIEGGIIYVQGIHSLFNNNTFQINITNSTVFGGVACINSELDSVKNSTFIDNTVTTNINNYEVYGGAVNAEDTVNLTTDNYSNHGIIKAKTIENKTTYAEGNLTVITKEEAVIKISAPTKADTGSVITINITVTDKKNNLLVGKTGKVAVKINGITVRDVKTNSSIIELYNGKGSINVSLGGLSGSKNYTISAVFSKAQFKRTENTTKIFINKMKYKAFTLNFNASSEEKIRIKQTLKDTNGNIIYGVSKVAIKLGDRTVKTLSVTNGNLDTTVTVPFLPQGKNKFIITLGENYRYDSLRINQTINIHKQNVTATIKDVKAKAGDKISVEATLLNKDTKTKVLSGKYIFKVNGVTIPAIINNKEVYTTQNVANGIAKGTYTLPKDMKKGSYDITIAYQGNTQSNALKYAQKSLTII